MLPMTVSFLCVEIYFRTKMFICWKWFRLQIFSQKVTLYVHKYYTPTISQVYFTIVNVSERENAFSYADTHSLSQTHRWLNVWQNFRLYQDVRQVRCEWINKMLTLPSCLFCCCWYFLTLFCNGTQLCLLCTPMLNYVFRLPSLLPHSVVAVVDVNASTLPIHSKPNTLMCASTKTFQAARWKMKTKT